MARTPSRANLRRAVPLLAPSPKVWARRGTARQVELRYQDWQNIFPRRSTPLHLRAYTLQLLAVSYRAPTCPCLPLLAPACPYLPLRGTARHGNTFATSSHTYTCPYLPQRGTQSTLPCSVGARRSTTPCQSTPFTEGVLPRRGTAGSFATKCLYPLFDIYLRAVHLLAPICLYLSHTCHVPLFAPLGHCVVPCQFTLPIYDWHGVVPLLAVPCPVGASRGNTFATYPFWARRCGTCGARRGTRRAPSCSAPRANLRLARRCGASRSTASCPFLPQRGTAKYFACPFGASRGTCTCV